jgi:hypothetical protein
MEKPLPEKLKAFLSSYSDKFDEGWLEKDYSEGDDKPWSYWVYLKKGWANTEVDRAGGMHIIHESSVREVKRQFKLAQRCTCEDCKIAKSKR